MVWLWVVNSSRCWHLVGISVTCGLHDAIQIQPAHAGTSGHTASVGILGVADCKACSAHLPASC